MFGVERGVVFGESWVARVTEDAFDEVEVADEISRREEADLHRLFRRNTRDGGADDWAQKQREKAAGRLCVCGVCWLWRGREKGQLHELGGRSQRVVEQAAKDIERHGLFIVGDGQPAFGDVKEALSGAPVAARVVQDALADAVRADDCRLEMVAVGRQRKRPRQSVAIEDEGRVRELGCPLAKESVEVVLDTSVSGAKKAREQPIFFAA